MLTPKKTSESEKLSKPGIAEVEKVDFVRLIGHAVIRECEQYILGESPVCDKS